MEYLIFVFKQGSFKTYTINNYEHSFLKKLFYDLGTNECTYIVYDFKLNKYDEGKVSRNGDIKPFIQNENVYKRS